MERFFGVDFSSHFGTEFNDDFGTDLSAAILVPQFILNLVKRCELITVTLNKLKWYDKKIAIYCLNLCIATCFLFVKFIVRVAGTFSSNVIWE